jgi:peptidoglycan/LPS O-acetylase OafA/YrhL
MDRSNIHVPALDGIRGLAVLGVMAEHYEIRDWPWRAGWSPVWHAIQLGGIGVDLFFVLSGFLITGILLDTRSRSHYFRTFMLRRALRIFPLYYVALVIIFVLVPLALPAQFPDTPGAVQVWYWSYLANFLLAGWGWASGALLGAHFWSLAVEEQFYLFWPLLVWLCSRRALTLACAVCVLGALALRMWAFDLGEDHLVSYTLMPMQMDNLAIGALGALAIRSDRARIALGQIVLPATLVLGLCALLLEQHQHWAIHTDFVAATFGHSLWAMFFGALVFLGATLPRERVLTRLLAARGLRTLGKYSYGLYVWHYIVLNILRSMGFSAAAAVSTANSEVFGHTAFIGVNFLLTASMAALSWHCLEEPVLSLRFRISKASAADPATDLPEDDAGDPNAGQNERRLDARTLG